MHWGMAVKSKDDKAPKTVAESNLHLAQGGDAQDGT